MKTRILFLIAVAAVATLSFTFAGKSSVTVKEKQVVAKKSTSEPVGGFVSEDKL